MNYRSARWRRFAPALVACAVLAMAPGLAASERPAADAAEAICPLLTGSKIPDITLKKSDGSSFDLVAEVSRKPSVLIFYRGGW